MTPLIFTQFGIWTLGTLGVLDVIAATTNASNGALLARRPDHYRHFTVADDKGGGPTFDKVMRGLRPFQKHGVASNILTTVNRVTGDRPLEVYRLLPDEAGTNGIQLIPVVERVNDHGRTIYQDGTEVSEHSLPAEQFGSFIIRVFHDWVHRCGQRFRAGVRAECEELAGPASMKVVDLRQDRAADRLPDSRLSTRNWSATAGRDCAVRLPKGGRSFFARCASRVRSVRVLYIPPKPSTTASGLTQRLANGIRHRNSLARPGALY